MVRIVEGCKSKSKKFVDKVVVVNSCGESTIPYLFSFNDASENMFKMVG